MSDDLKRVADDLKTDAMLAAGKSVTKRALAGLVSSDEERAEEAAVKKRKRTKLLIFGIIGLFVVLGVIGMVVNYWQWFLLAGLVGLAMLYGRYRWRKRRERVDAPAPNAAADAEPPVAKLPPEAPNPALEKEQRAREAAAREAQTQAEAQAIDEELAALKQRFKP